MRGMILVAGLGERMLPLTLQKAKPALPLFNKPFLVHSIEYLRRFGIVEVAVNLHHLPGTLTGILDGGSEFGVKILYSYEPSILGTAGGLKKVEDFLGSGRFILMNSDFISDIDIEKAVEWHNRKKALSTLVVMRSSSQKYSKLVVDETMRVRIIGDARGDFIFCGIHVLEPEIFEYIPSGQKLDINRDIYRRLIQDGRLVQAYEHKGYWHEFGNLNRYMDGHRELTRRGLEFIGNIINVQRKGIYCRMNDIDPGGSSGAEDELFLFCEEDSFIAEGATLSGTIVLGSGCRIERSASVRDSIMHERAVIGERASIKESIIGESVRVPAGADLRRAAISLLPSRERIGDLSANFVIEGNLVTKYF